MRIGSGWDSHRLVSGRPLLLGGVVIESSTLGEDGHSDGDVLLHAIIDALLGAAALGDIGKLFPPSDPQWKDADSSQLLKTAYRKVRESSGMVIANIDTTVILQEPRLAPYIMQIRERIADTLNLTIDAVSVKAKSAEGLGPVGRGESIEAQAVLLLEEESIDRWV